MNAVCPLLLRKLSIRKNPLGSVVGVQFPASLK